MLSIIDSNYRTTREIMLHCFAFHGIGRHDYAERYWNDAKEYARRMRVLEQRNRDGLGPCIF